MSPIPVSISQEDLLRGKIVTPGWYKLQIGDFELEMTKAGDSQNAVAKGTKIICAENGDEEFANVPIRLAFSMKPTARGFMVGFLAVLNGGEVAPNKNYDLAAASGKQIMAFVGNGLYNGNPTNELSGKWRAIE